MIIIIRYNCTVKLYGGLPVSMLSSTALGCWIQELPSYATDTCLQQEPGWGITEMVGVTRSELEDSILNTFIVVWFGQQSLGILNNDRIWW